MEALNKAWEPVAQKMYQASQETASKQDPNSNNDASSNNASDSANESIEDADYEVVEDEK